MRCRPAATDATRNNLYQLQYTNESIKRSANFLLTFYSKKCSNFDSKDDTMRSITSDPNLHIKICTCAHVNWPTHGEYDCIAIPWPVHHIKYGPNWPTGGRTISHTVRSPAPFQTALRTTFSTVQSWKSQVLNRSGRLQIYAFLAMPNVATESFVIIGQPGSGYCCCCYYCTAQLRPLTHMWLLPGQNVCFSNGHFQYLSPLASFKEWNNMISCRTTISVRVRKTSDSH